MSTPTTKLPESDPIMKRLEDQLARYDRKSMANQGAYKRIKVLEIVAAAIIPFLAALGRPHIGMVTGGLGVLITVLEGMLHLNQYQQNWINYRSTCEALKHEKYTYLGKAAPYADAPDPFKLLSMTVPASEMQHHSLVVIGAEWPTIGFFILDTSGSRAHGEDLQSHDACPE